MDQRPAPSSFDRLLAIACVFGILVVVGVTVWLLYKSGASIIAPIIVRPRSNGQQRTWHRLSQRVVEKYFALETDTPQASSLPRNRDGPRARR